MAALSLPALPEKETLPAQNQPSSPDEPVQGNGELILVVDDERQQRDITGSMLTTLGYRVETTASGEEALNMTRRKEYDLLLLDMIMGRGMNGSETFLAVRKEYPQQKAVILSGYSQSKEVDKALAAGAAGILKKPITIARLSRGIRNALAS